MSTTELTGGDLRRAVYGIIVRELGTSALVRFLQENYPGQGDYTALRQQAERPDIDHILAELKNPQAKA